MKSMGLFALGAAALVGLPAFAQTPVIPSDQPQAAAPKPKPHGRNRSGVYIQGGFESLVLAEDPYSEDPAFAAIQARLGYSINPYIAIEAQGELSVMGLFYDEDGEIDDANELKLKQSYGLFIVPRAPIGRHFGLYGRLGYVQTDYKYDPPGSFWYATSAHGPAAGVGLDVDFGAASIAYDLTFSALKSTDEPGPGPDYDTLGVSFVILGGFHF